MEALETNVTARGRETKQGEEHAANRGRFAVASLATVFLILLSAFGVIHSTYACRELYAQLQGIESDHWLLQEQHRQLLIEQSTLASYARVESVAREDLGMRAPDLVSFRVLPQ